MSAYRKGAADLLLRNGPGSGPVLNCSGLLPAAYRVFSSRVIFRARVNLGEVLNTSWTWWAGYLVAVLFRGK